MPTSPLSVMSVSKGGPQTVSQTLPPAPPSPVKGGGIQLSFINRDLEPPTLIHTKQP